MQRLASLSSIRALRALDVWGNVSQVGRGESVDNLSLKSPQLHGRVFEVHRVEVALPTFPGKTPWLRDSSIKMLA